MANTNQNNDGQKSTNTRGVSISGNGTVAGAVAPLLLIVSYWNDMLKLLFCQELPESQRTENRRFDRDNGILTCVSRDKCNELYNLYKDKIKPRLDDTESVKEDLSVSVTIAEVNQLILGIEVGEDGEYRSYISLAKGIDPSTLISNNVIKFEFPKGEYILNYKPETGSFDERVITHNGIDVFCKDMDDFRRASNKAYIHAARQVDYAYKEMIRGGIVTIGEKVGANMSNMGVGNSRYGRTGSQDSIFNRNGGGSPINPPTMTLDELDQELAAAEGTVIN